MKRRAFITMLVGAIAAPAMLSPRSARAQQARPVIGFLHTGMPELNTGDVAGFRQGLSEAGFIDGQNMTVEFRWARDRYEQLPALAAELVRLPANVIFTLGGVAPAMAAKTATSSIPIVFAHGADPVKTGLVASMNRPDGNITGVTIFNGVLTAKRLELLRELVPKATVIAVLVNPRTATGEARIVDVEEAARALGVQTRILNAATTDELDAAFATLRQHRADALFVIADPLFRSHRDKINELANRHRIPAMHSSRDAVVAGGLIGYGSRLAEATRQAGNYVGRILKGEKPADLPVLQPTKFELVINLKAAKALGLTVPLTLQASADEVIE